MGPRDGDWRAARPVRRPLGGVSIVFVGADGAGKSTVIQALQDAWPQVTRYVYMGASIGRANYSLPTSRWLTRYKLRRLERCTSSAVLPPARQLSDEQRAQLPSGRVVRIAGVINRIAEEWYRHCVVTLFKLRGYTVFCDRHFLFEYDLAPGAADPYITERIHHWLLRRVYPRPDLVIFLDAEPDELQRRKPEWTLEHIENQRRLILAQRDLVRDLVRVDASQPLDAVISEAASSVRAVPKGESSRLAK